MDNKKKNFRKLSELSLIDDYLFGLFIQENDSDELIREMLEIMLDKKIKSIKFADNQHTILNDTDKKGIRLDAIVVDNDGVIYNVEVQTANLKNLPKRMRYYQSLIDRENMPSGEIDYNKLSKTIIIFVAGFDVFGKGLYRYSFKNICMEDSSIALGDGTEKIVLNTRGICPDSASKELIELLKYFQNSTEDTANTSESGFVRKLDRKLEPIKNSPKFGGAYMSLFEKIYTEKYEASMQSFIKACFIFTQDFNVVIEKVMEQFSLPREIAEEYVKEYMPAVN